MSFKAQSKKMIEKSVYSIAFIIN